MKKILSTLALAAAMTTVVSADMMRIEMGGGVWKETPSGYAKRTDSGGVLHLNGTYTSREKESSEAYAWLLIKHPIFIIPNIRLEYVSISDEGLTSGSVNGINIPGSAPTTMDIKEYDIIPYYNLLDNTFWTTIDLGLDAKVIESDVVVSPVTGFSGYTTTDTTVIPLVYVRGRIEIPSTGLGLEADVKAITDGTDTMYDVRAKIDYTFDFDVIQPGIEVGYRTQKVKIDDGSTQVDLDYSGVYAGLMLRF
ncbi:TIGR04219 family outer membrane beta-barrel protein [Sulfurimonas sp. NWX79]